MMKSTFSHKKLLFPHPYTHYSPHDGDECAKYVGEQNTRNHHQLEEGAEQPSDFGVGNLGDVHWRRDAKETAAKSGDQSPHDQHLDRRWHNDENPA
jgi:hypothetical protein